MNKRFMSLSVVLALLLTTFVSVLAPMTTVFAEDIATNEAEIYLANGTQEFLSLNVGSDETMRNVVWRFPSANGKVEYAVKNGSTFPSNFTSVKTVATAYDTTYIHRATMTNLAPDTEYVYRIVNDSVVSKNYYFTTDPTDSFNFIFVGDPQIGASGNSTVDGNNWANTMNVANQMFPGTSMLISAGDQVDNGSATVQYTGYFSPSVLTSYASATTIGNHDSGTADYGGKSDYSYYFYNPNTTVDGQVLGATPAGGNYWYTYNNTLFMNLNANNLSVAEHNAFLKAAIKANPDVTWKIVVMHHSIFGGTNNYLSDSMTDRRNGLAPIFKALDIDVVLSGHDHIYSRTYMITDGFTPNPTDATSVTDSDGILYLTAGSSSASKYYGLADAAKTPHAAVREANTMHFSNIEITENSFKLTTYRTNDKSVLDTFEIKKDKELFPKDPNAVVYENIALDKTYDAPTPGTYCADLTDGVSDADVKWKGEEWYAIKNGLNVSGNIASIDFDFKTLYDISSVRLHVLDGGENEYSGISSARSFEVYTSKDGKTYSKAGDIEVKTAPSGVNLHVYWTGMTLGKTIEARYVRVNITLPENNKMIMLNEVEVYGKLSPNAYEPEEDAPDNNIALNKTYVTSALYSSNGVVSYPDENGKSFTDGKSASAEDAYSSEVYAAFNKQTSDYKANGYSFITVDLGSVYSVDKFIAHVATQMQGAGIKAPQTVTVYVSEDNETWVEAGSANPYDSTISKTDATTVELKFPVSARYVQYRFIAGTSNWIMVSEVEVYEAKTVEDAPVVNNGNLALNKEYTANGIHVVDGVPAYPDEEGISLTDGIIAPPSAIYSNVEYVGFNVASDFYKANGYFSVEIDLGESYYLDTFVAYVATVFNTSGILAPTLMEVYVSDDNSNWNFAGSVVPVDDPLQSCVPATVTLENSVKGRYVQYRFNPAKSWVMLAEVEVYEGEPYEAPEEPDKPDVMLGDVNDDEKVDSVDYLLVKRACFKTYTLNEEETLRADVNCDNKIDSTDYLLVKRIAFGTYTVK